MSYQALYRSWRPEHFHDIIGQERIITTLVHQITSDRIAHAYLFCGSRGTGKTTTAKVLSRAINCTNAKDGEPCGTCEVCRQLSGENNLDIVEMDAASNRRIDDARDLLDKIQYPPTVGRYKVYIVDEVHMLTTEAFNALLKTLEEPPAHAVFILATTEPQRLPATILSRCQRFDFKRIPAALIEGRLRTVLQGIGAEADDEALALIARAAEGGMRDALSILDMCLAYGQGHLQSQLVREVLGASDRSFLFDFVDALLQGDVPRALSLIDRLMRDGRDPAVFCREVTGHARSLLVAQTCQEGLEDLLEVTSEDANRLREQAQSTSQARLMRVMTLFLQAESDMKWATQSRVILELSAVRSCHPEREASEEALLDRVATLEKALKEGVVVSKAPSAPVSQSPAAPQKEEKPEKPRPSAHSTPTPTDGEAYNAAFKALKRQDVSVAMLLNKARFVGVEADDAIIEFKGNSTFITSLFKKQEKMDVLEKCLSDAFGRPMHARLICTGDAIKGAPSPAQARKTMNQMHEAFPREKIEIIDDFDQ